ncbi:MAG: PfkB family carbohydrate kinase [Candidatus Omnitrophota bacterium]|nr:carbohydrate kinase family protein [Candidatus Omnitrophota bacterium]
MHPDRKFQYDAVVSGYIGVDLTPLFPSARGAVPLPDIFRPGKLVEVEGLNLSLGGVANTGLAMRKFGRRVALMGLVGNDILGDFVAGQLQAQGMASGIRRTNKAGTAYGIVIAPPGTDRIFLEGPGCNGIFTSTDINYDTVGKSRLFHFGYPTLMKSLFVNGGAELRNLLAGVRKLKVITSLDMSLPDPGSLAGQADWRSILAAVLPFVDVFVPSIEEILFMLEPKRYGRILSEANGGDIMNAVSPDLILRLGNRILAMGVKVLMIKAGHRGAYLRTGDIGKLNAATSLNLPSENWNGRDFWIPAFPADPRRVRNACGAGDCAVAGFLAAMLEGADIEKTGRYAMLAGRDNLYGIDSLDGLSDWKHMTKMLLI